MIFRTIAFALLLGGCSDPPEATAPPAQEAQNIVYLYARLHESQSAADAEAQYRENLTAALAGYEHKLEIEELRGIDDTVEFIGIDFQITAPGSETESLETRLMNALRLSGAPYATQILIYEP